MSATTRWVLLVSMGAALASTSCPRSREDTPYSVHLSPANTRAVLVYGDGTYALAAGIAEGWDKGFLCIHDLDDGHIIWHERWPDMIFGLACSPAGDRIASGDSSGTVAIWRVQKDGTLAKESQSAVGDSVESLCWPTEALLVAGTQSGAICVLQTDPLEELRKLHAHSSWVISLTASPDGRYVASGGRDGNLVVWELRTWSRVREFTAGQWPRELHWSPTGKWLVAVYSHARADKPETSHMPSTQPASYPSLFGMLKAWRTDTWEEIYAYTVKDNAILHAAFLDECTLSIFDRPFDTPKRRADRPSRAVNIDLSTKKMRPLPWGTAPNWTVYLAGGSKLLTRWGCHGLSLYRVSDGQLVEVWRQGRK